MFQHNRLSSELTFFQKIKNLDYILLFSILSLCVISVFVMYSTDGGQILYHTKSHFIKLLIFFPLMIVISLFNIKFWHTTSYFFLFYYYFAFDLGFCLWSNSIRITKMDKSLFYSSATL